MDILGKINKEHLTYIMDHKKNAKFCYLGQAEAGEFCKRMQAFLDLEEEPKVSQGLEFIGLKIIEVANGEHFNIG